MRPCASCHHPWEEHATDPCYPDAMRCFHGAATGEGCADKYTERCRQYIDPDTV